MAPSTGSSTTYGQRMRQNLLLCMTRGICQFGRLAWSPLVIFISKDLNLSTLQQGQLLSAFPLGYLLTQILGGMAADKFGGKPVQTVTLLVFATGMLLGPTVSTISGARGLYWIYFWIGFFAGPQHPATATMTSAWMRQDELGSANGMQDVGVIAGELLATFFAPLLASEMGWGHAFIAIGISSGSYCVAWQVFARSKPPAATVQTLSEKASGKEVSTTKDTGASDNLSGKDVSAAEKEVAPAEKENPSGRKTLHSVTTEIPPPSAYPPLDSLLYVQVWSVIFQHMCFNGSKYFFTSWMATYYDKVFRMGPAQSAAYLSAEKFVGISVPVVWRGLEKSLLSDGGASKQLLRCRKVFMGIAFGINAFAAVCLMQLHARVASIEEVSAGQSSFGPLLVAALLCVNSAGTAAHSFGFKTNYMDLTSQYAGVLMGVGNMFATFMTWAVPLGAAHLMEATGGDWSLLFLGIALLNLFGAGVGVSCTSVERLDSDLECIVRRRRNKAFARARCHSPGKEA